MLVVPYLLLSLYILFIKKKDKYTWILVAIMLSFLSITSVDYADLSNYGPLFNAYNNGIVPIKINMSNLAWALLCRLFYSIGLNYRGMVIVLIFVNSLLINFAIKNLHGEINIVFGLFLLFPAVIQVVQLKFFTASTVVFFAYSVFLLNLPISLPVMIIGIILGISIHSSAAAFSILLLLLFTKLSKKIIIFASIAIAIIIGLLLNQVTIIASKFLPVVLVRRYFIDTISPSSMSWIITIASIWISSYLISYYLSNLKVKSSINPYYKNTQEKIVSNKCLLTVGMMSFCIPLLLLDRNYHRFLEFGFMIMFIIASKVLRIGRKSRKKDFAFALFLVAYLVLISTIYSPYNSVLKPLFSYEGIVNIFRG